MTSRQQRIDYLYESWSAKGTKDLIKDELPYLIELIKLLQRGHLDERVAVLESILQRRGYLRMPPERPSERAMRISRNTVRSSEDPGSS